MKKLAKLSALVLLAAGLAALVIWSVARTGAPWWAGIYIVTGVAGIILLFWFIRKLWLKRREKKFVNELLDQDQSALTSDEKAYADEIKDRWKTAMKDLKGSHLRKIGNPLYVLPWYMIIGESGAGKTTAIRNSHLTANFAEPNRLSGFSGTKNCDWWFFEKAIILDTAGRYAIPENEARDKDEWHTFLTHLSKYRKKEPVNGLIVTISADKLLTAGTSELDAHGKKIRTRIEELMQFLGAKCPVHVLVTKCDLIQGMNSFSDHLPEASLSQPFGHLNNTCREDAMDFLDNAFLSITDRLKELRLLVSYRPGHDRISPDILLFPEEFDKLKPGLETFFKSAFQQNVYQETTLIRGIYFTSAQQTGTPISHFLDTMGVTGDKDELPATENSLFIHDFFSRVLPTDRYLFAPTQKAIDWKKRTRRIGGLAWLAIAATFCGLLSLSFAKNLSTIREAQYLAAHPPVLEGELLQDIAALEELRTAIVTIQERNRNWMLPRFGMTQSLDMEAELKKKYCDVFKNDYLAPFDERLEKQVVNINRKAAPKEIGQVIPHIVRRVNLIRHRLDGADTPDALKAAIQPDYRFFISTDGRPVVPKALNMYAGQYLDYLTWEDKAVLTAEAGQLRDRLRHFAQKKEISLKWLVSWCNANPDIPGLTLADFWGGSTSLKEEAVIPGAFTVQGKKEIEAFLTEFEQALDAPLDIAKKKMEYDQWYRTSYLTAWYDFGKSFSRGAARLTGTEEKLVAAMKMAMAEGPYFAFLNRITQEVSPLAKGADKAAARWIALLLDYDSISREAESLSQKGDKSGGSGALNKLGAKAARKTVGKTRAGKIGMKAAATASESAPANEELIAAAAQALNTYKQALKAMARSTLSPQAAHAFSSAAFGQDPATGASPLFAARQGLKQIRASMERTGGAEKMVRSLLAGPERFLWSFICGQTGCFLQKKWEDDVLSEIEATQDQKILNGLLWGDEGYVPQYTKGVAAPFIGRTRKKGFYAKKMAGERIRFTQPFFTFLKRRDIASKSVREEYKVRIKALPTESNPNAQLIPDMTRIELSCAAGVQSLTNRNYPIKQDFVWSQNTCGDAVLWIHVGDLKLSRRYTGFKPFARLLKDFRKGQRTFYRDDFPKYSNDLKRIGVEYIKVKYKISGAEPVIKLLNAASAATPGKIVSCLD